MVSALSRRIRSVTAAAAARVGEGFDVGAVEEDVLTGRQQVEAELLGPPGLGGETAGRFRLADHDT